MNTHFHDELPHTADRSHEDIAVDIDPLESSASQPATEPASDLIEKHTPADLARRQELLKRIGRANLHARIGATGTHIVQKERMLSHLRSSEL